jgi:hypothetical protein
VKPPLPAGFSYAPGTPKGNGNSLFDRITPPKDSDSSVFGATSKPASNPFAAFNPTPAAGTGIFGSAQPSTGIFGSANGASSGTSVFAPAASPSTEKSEDATPAEGEPSDTPPDPSKSTDLSGKGPGEEDEDSLFSVRALIYDLTGGGTKKEGVGQLRVLKNRNNGKARIIVRSDIGKVLMNVALQPNVEYTVVQQRLLKVPEFLEGGIKIWGTKCGKEENAATLLKIVEEAKKV